MKMKFLLLELKCTCKQNKPIYCEYGINETDVHCIENKCEFLEYLNCNNELIYSGNGIIENTESYANITKYLKKIKNKKLRKQNIKKWKEISLKKINEAFYEYMKFKESNYNI